MCNNVYGFQHLKTLFLKFMYLNNPSGQIVIVSFINVEWIIKNKLLLKHTAHIIYYSTTSENCHEKYG